MTLNEQISERIKNRLIPLIIQYEEKEHTLFTFCCTDIGTSTYTLSDIQLYSELSHLNKPGSNGTLLILCNSMYKFLKGQGYK